MNYGYGKVNELIHYIRNIQHDIPENVINEFCRYINYHKIKNINNEIIKKICNKNKLEIAPDYCAQLSLQVKNKLMFENIKDRECVICYDEIKSSHDIVYLECCKHVFCKRCIQNIIKHALHMDEDGHEIPLYERYAHCPLCRHNYTVYTLVHKIELDTILDKNLNGFRYTSVILVCVLPICQVETCTTEI